jgi:hypothetical protein
MEFPSTQGGDTNPVENNRELAQVLQNVGYNSKTFNYT